MCERNPDRESHQRELVDGSCPFYKTAPTHLGNTTNGSWWMVHVLSTEQRDSN
ncbi:MAG TPA: hypothetical protein VKB46_28565 [Pyrinomonadaceae bacterium]|nr:hypothetical protein [Pyrinomonadaceae bacterium]